jgi:carboxypeptidase family protein
MVTVTCVAQAPAEGPTPGNLSGVVVDSSGTVITGASVSVSGAIGTKTDLTNQDGGFLFPLLDPGRYDIRIEKPGFKAAAMKDVEAISGKTSAIHIKMQAGSAAETIQLSANTIIIDGTRTIEAPIAPDPLLDLYGQVHARDPFFTIPHCAGMTCVEFADHDRLMMKKLEGVPIGRTLGDLISMF